MRLRITSFRTKVARRIFTLFIICAIVPITALVLVSYIYLNTQLKEQSEKRLRQESKTLAVSMYERLSFLRTELRSIASSLAVNLSNPFATPPEVLAQKRGARFSCLALVTCERSFRPLIGQIRNPRKLTVAQRQHINSGKALLYHRVNPGDPPTIVMGVALNRKLPELGILLGKVNETYLWEVAERRPPMTEVCILDGSNALLFTTFKESTPPFSRKMLSSHCGQFELYSSKETYLASYYSIFLKPNFFTTEWRIVLSEAKKNVLAPMADFQKSFPFIIFLSLGFVILFSIILIRKNLVPIEILRQATQKIAEGDLGHEVEIRSADEFESLGKSFNEMRKKLKEGQVLLVRAAKMSTMGQMAAGIVHEIKQPLTPIYGLLELSLMEKLPAKGRKNLQAALEAVERLNGILGRFQSFSFKSPETVEKLSVKQAIDQVYKLLEHQFTMNNTQCITEIDEDLPSILADNQGLQQVFSNLLINALHALENKNDGQRTIKIRAYSSKATVSVEVEDNGCGITQEIQERIFDPFFTTKGTDKGTGLGMAIVESILHSHHAQIDIESEVGVGTRFTIVFPAASQNNH